MHEKELELGLELELELEQEQESTDHRCQSLQTTASFIETGGADAVEHIAQRLSTTTDAVRYWYVKWQMVQDGPARL